MAALLARNPKAVRLGFILRETCDRYGLSRRELFEQLSLGEGLLLEPSAFLTACRTRLMLKRGTTSTAERPGDTFVDADILDTLAAMAGPNKAGRAVNLGEFSRFLDLFSGQTAARWESTNKEAMRSNPLAGAGNMTPRTIPRDECDPEHQEVNYTFLHNGSATEFFRLPFSGTWRLYCRGAYGGSFAMQEGGRPVEICARFTGVAGHCLAIGVGGAGTLGGGGGGSLVAVIGDTRSFNEAEIRLWKEAFTSSSAQVPSWETIAEATLLVVAGGGGGVGLLDGVEGSLRTVGEPGMGHRGADLKRGGKRGDDGSGGDSGGGPGRGTLASKAADGRLVVTAASLRRLASQDGYGGAWGGGDAAASYSLSRPARPTPVSDPPSFLAGGGGGGGLSGGGGGALAGGGGGSFVDLGAAVETFDITKGTKHNISRGGLGHGSVVLSFLG